MKRILYAAIFLFNFSIFQSLHVKKYKNRAHENRGELFGALEDGIRSRRQLYKWPSGILNRRRADKHSGSIEKMKYQDEFRELHEQKKKEAFEAKSVEADEVNMVAARPEGVPCGDPDQHDMPWGNCMRPEQCPPEYRVYRGDYACGYTTYVCCALQLTGDDTIVPLDASFGSDFEEDHKKKVKKKKKKHSSSKKSRKLEDRRRREEARKKRKKRMQKIIKRITRKIERAFKGDSKIRKKKTREFKKFLKRLKRKYDESRLLVRDRHREVLNRTDREREERLKKIYKKNKEFIRDVTDWRPEVRVPSAEASEDVTESPDDREVNSKDNKEVNAEDDKEVNSEDDKEVNAEDDREVNAEDYREVNAEDDREVNAEDDREVNAEDDKEVNAEDDKEVNTEDDKEVNVEDDKEVNVEDDKEVNAEDGREVNSEDNKEVRPEENDDEVNTEPSRRRTHRRHAHGYVNHDNMLGHKILLNKRIL